MSTLRAIIDALDASQALFEGEPIDRRYFSQSQSYAETVRLMALVAAYLLRASYDLKAEKRFTLARARNPVMVCIEEYGGLGEGDELLDLFIATNALEGNELIMMPAGREVVVYV